MTITIGCEAIARPSSLGAGYTVVNKGNPAGAAGTITSVEVWLKDDADPLYIGIFYTTNGNTLKCRSSQNVGAVATGDKRTIPVTLSVEIGDYIGMYALANVIELTTSGGAGVWYREGEYIDVDDEATFQLGAAWVISLYGTGEEPAVGSSRGFIIG